MELIRNIGALIFLFLPLFSFSQNENLLPKKDVDSLYREDQFYFGLTYNIMAEAPSGYSAIGLSGGLQAGFLRDMPINERRNLAVAVGLGFAYDQFGQNLFVGEDTNGKSIFRVLEGSVDYSENKFKMAMVEVPLEFRWRTSTAADYKFWRIYAGARIGYAYWYKSTFRQENNTVVQSDIPEFNPLRLSATLSMGYSTFNFFASYSLNPFFDNAVTEGGQKMNVKALKVGLMFYIL